MPNILEHASPAIDTGADGTLGFVGVRSRLLPVSEWPRLRPYGPFAAAGVLPDPSHALVLVLERYDVQAHGPRIVGCWMAKNTVILEGLYLNPEERHLAPSARHHLFSMIGALQERGVTEVITLIQSPEVLRLAPKAGFVELPGSVHLLKLPSVEAP